MSWGMTSEHAHMREVPLNSELGGIEESAVKRLKKETNVRKLMNRAEDMVKEGKRMFPRKGVMPGWQIWNRYNESLCLQHATTLNHIH